MDLKGRINSLTMDIIKDIQEVGATTPPEIFVQPLLTFHEMITSRATPTRKTTAEFKARGELILTQIRLNKLEGETKRLREENERLRGKVAVRPKEPQQAIYKPKMRGRNDFTGEQKVEIIELYTKGCATQTELGQTYGTFPATISKILLDALGRERVKAIAQRNAERQRERQREKAISRAAAPST
jgi:hypothetical protein